MKNKNKIKMFLLCDNASCFSYPECPHRQGGLPRVLKVARLQDRIPAVAALHRFILYICTRRSGCTAHEGGGATSRLDLPFLTPLSFAGCGRLQPGVPHWATSVEYCK